VSVKSRLARRLGVLRSVAFVTYKEWSAYRTHSMVSILVGPAYFLVQYFIWAAVYGNAGGASVRGLELSNILAYYGANALIGYLTMDFADWNLGMLVRTGKYLTFALRPLHHRWFALSQKIGHRALGFAFEALPCFLIFTFVFRIPLVPAHPGWTALSVALAFLMTFYVNYTIGLAAFWFVRAEGVRAVFQILQAAFSGALIPLTFFPEGLQKALLFLPFQYMIYVPSMVWAGGYRMGGLVLPIPTVVAMQAVAVVAMAALSELAYRASMRRFNGVGA
jgi:ABC-2 type transport system permease protein